MATHYTLPNFLRQASNKLLAQYFSSNNIDIGLDPAALKARNFQPLVEAVEQLSDAQQARINQDFQKVTALASRGGIRQIVQEAQFRRITLAPDFEAQKSHLNRIFWTYLHHPDVFDGAAQFAPPFLAGRYWKRNLPVAGAALRDPEQATEMLEAAVSGYFRREEGRGKACKVEYRQRDSQHLFHAFPEDYPSAPLAWSKFGLEPHPLRPAFEVIFVFNDAEETLDIYLDGPKSTVERLWQIFAATALGIPQLHEPDKPSFALQSLKSADFSFVRTPESPIVDIRIKRLGFAISGYPSTTVSVETDVSRDPDAIHDRVRRTFGDGEAQPGRFNLSQARVISARIRATIDRHDGSRPRTRTFDVSEKSCGLKYEGEDLLLRRMLVDSGIDRTGKQGNGSKRSRRQVA